MNLIKKLLAIFLWLSIWGMTTMMAQPPDALVEQYAKTITPTDLEAHLSFLADDMLEGRETGTRGQKLAAKYIRSQFQGMGLAPGTQGKKYFQYYQIRKKEVKGFSMALDGKKYYSYKQDFFVYQANIPETLPTELVFAGYGISRPAYDNLKGVELGGKGAVMLVGDPQAAKPLGIIEQYQQSGARASALLGAGASSVFLIFPDSTYRTLSRYVSLISSEVGEVETESLPIFFLSEAMGERLLKMAKTSVDKMKLSLAVEATVPSLSFAKAKLKHKGEVIKDAVKVENVLGFIEGTDKKEEVLVITAHYDHIGIASNGEINNGADDDGSGTSAVLELAEAFAIAAAAGHRPRRSILFMTVSGEEKGLWGSEFYADHPEYPLENTVANLNIDMIGRIDEKYETRADSTSYVYLIGSDKLSSDLHELSETVNDTYANLTLDYTYNDENDPNRFYYRSDHYNFAKNNIPVIFYFNGTHDDYHRPTDEVVKIRFGKIAKIAKLVFATAWEIANRDARLEVDKAPK